MLQNEKDLVQENEDVIYNSNIIKDVYYISKDSEGNEYIIKAKEGEIDLDNTFDEATVEVQGYSRTRDLYGGGVAMYIQSHIPVKLRRDLMSYVMKCCGYRFTYPT